MHITNFHIETIVKLINKPQYLIRVVQYQVLTGSRDAS